MDIIQAIILSIVEGITEFLPISSTGHLILVSELLKIQQTEFVKSFEVIVQLGAVLAVVVFYFRKIISNFKLWKILLAGFLPTAVIGFGLYSVVKQFLLGNVQVTLWALLLGGIALIVFEKNYKAKEQNIDDISKLSLKQAALIGLAQSVSIIPGVSRAAASIIGGLIVGLKRPAAVEFSFLLALPTMMAATGLDLIKANFAFNGEEYFILVVGMIGSFITALLAIKFFLNFIEKHNFIPFGIYRIILALLFWLVILKPF